MNNIKKFLGRLFIALLIIAIFANLVWLAADKNFPIIQDVLSDDLYGDIIVARPLIKYKNLVVIFVDKQKFRADDLSYRIAQTGVAVAVIDTERAIHAFSSGENHCLNPERIREPLTILSKWADASKDKHSIIAGVGNGALLPFFSATTTSGAASKNLSVGFSVNLPDGVQLCAPLKASLIDGHALLTSSPPLIGKWISVWTDQPEDNTAIFVRKLSGVETSIAPYDTKLDTVAVNEIQKIITDENTPWVSSMPIVEVPARHPNDTVTIFYSGDGGWRDLDRDVAGEMAKRGYPVVGVDTLRYFWSVKTPEKAADDLSALMAHYRKYLNAKKFVLAGYSFGADILPAIYNHLSTQDQKDVALIVLLAMGKTADFEIHVSGWIEKNNSGIPILPELNRIPPQKILCVFGQEEKDECACNAISTTRDSLMELPGGHHFDYDYPKLAAKLIETFQRIELKKSN